MAVAGLPIANKLRDAVAPGSRPEPCSTKIYLMPVLRKQGRNSVSARALTWPEVLLDEKLALGSLTQKQKHKPNKHEK